MFLKYFTKWQRFISLSFVVLAGFAVLGGIGLSACGGKKTAATDPNDDARCDQTNSVFCIDPDNPLRPGQRVYFGQTLSISKHGVFQQLMEGFGGFCSRHYSIGFSDCESYDDNGYIIIEAVPGSSVATIYIGAGLSQPPNGYNYPTGWNNYFNEFPIPNVQIYKSNNNQGIEFVANGYPGTPSYNNVGLGGFRGKVSNGSLTSDAFDIVLSYAGEEFARARVLRYNSYY